MLHELHSLVPYRDTEAQPSSVDYERLTNGEQKESVLREDLGRTHRVYEHLRFGTEFKPRVSPVGRPGFKKISQGVLGYICAVSDL